MGEAVGAPVRRAAGAGLEPCRRICCLQLGLWTSLFVLSTLFINAPTIPAVLRFTGLTQAGGAARETGGHAQARLGPGALTHSAPAPLLPVQLSPVKLRIREKAKRALLRYTAASIRVCSGQGAGVRNLSALVCAVCWPCLSACTSRARCCSGFPPPALPCLPRT